MSGKLHNTPEYSFWDGPETAVLVDHGVRAWEAVVVVVVCLWALVSPICLLSVDLAESCGTWRRALCVGVGSRV